MSKIENTNFDAHSQSQFYMIIPAFSFILQSQLDSLSNAPTGQATSALTVLSDFFSAIAAFFNHPIFAIAGGITVLISSIALVYRLTSMFLGVSPILFRFAKAIWGRKIAIIGDAQAHSELVEVVKISKVFKSKNIKTINVGNHTALKSHSLILVDWNSCQGVINEIFAARANENTVVIVYAAPQSIPLAMMQTLPNRPNTIIVNAKGRLANDILISLLTSSFDVQ